MPKIAEEPKGLRAMSFHGVELLDLDKEQVPAVCPFCAKRKFSAHRDTGQWDCKTCGRSGNPLSFLRQLWEESQPVTEEFARDRSVLDVESLAKIGARRSLINGEVIVPAYGADGKLDNLYTYLKDRKSGKRILYPTPDFHAGTFGNLLFHDDRKTLYVVEGPWKVAVLIEILERTKRGADGSLSPTGNPAQSLLAETNVIGVPGCNTWHESWSAMASNKDVAILFDSDHPREVNGKVVPPVGWDAARRLSGKLASATEPPETIRVLRWGPDGYDPMVASGFDIRDNLAPLSTVRERVEVLGDLLDMIEPIPEDWLAGRSKETAAKGGVQVDVLPCSSWDDLVRQWRKAMRWTEGLDRTLSVMLASVLSTDMMDAQLWIKVVSPPSTGKTQLCDGIATARRRVRSVGNFTGLHSGFQTDAEGEEDHSLLSKIKDMTLVVKDGDTLLKAPNREKILSQIRDAYDTNCAVAYGNRVKREYLNHRFTFILAGTESLLELDSADLGARYLDCIIMSGIDVEIEQEVNRRGFHRIYNNRGIGANGTASTHADAEVVRAKAMTGGYVEHLRDSAADIRARVEIEDLAATQDAISALAQFVAHVRCRPSKTQQEAVAREMSARLNEQLTKLAICLAGAMSKTTVDSEVMRRVRQTAMDTARGKTLNLVRAIATVPGGVEVGHLETLSGAANATEVRQYLRFLKTIGVTEPVTRAERGQAGRVVQRLRWRLTEDFCAIYRDATGEEPVCRQRPITEVV